ncbi:MAG: hypothetical protein K8S97_07135 [Anaerolineae bacterium]|nr:hypothetical protein [Anaerolineae bacterium]
MAEQRNSGRAAMAVLLITLGMLPLMGWGLIWPVFVLLPGLGMLAIALYGGRGGAAAMSMPGTFVTGIGALLFVQNLTGYWASWAYAWTLLGVFVGLGFTLMGQRLDAPSLSALGRWFVMCGLGAFAFFGIFFELLIFNTGGALLPVLLIAVGLYMLTQDSKSSRALSNFLGTSEKAKQRPVDKRKHEDKLFSGPVVYGSRTQPRSDNLPVAVMDVHDAEAVPPVEE